MALVAPVVTAAGKVDTNDIAQDDLGFVAFMLAAAGWMAFLGIRERWTPRLGRRPSGGEGGERDLLDLPDDSPAVAEALCGGGGLTTTGIGVIVLDLARRGYLTIEEDGGGADYRFRRAKTPAGELRPYENAVYTRLFAGGGDSTLAGLAEWAATRRQQAGVFLDRIDKYVENELAASGYVQRPPREPVVANMGVAALVAVVGLAALLSGSPVGLLALASAAGQVAAGRLLRKRALLGTGRAGEWRQVAAALASFDTVDPDAPVPDAAGWDRLLVYAAALKVSRPFLAAAQRRHAALTTDTTVAAWFTGEVTGAARLEGPDRLARRLGDDLRAATRASLPLPARGGG